MAQQFANLKEKNLDAEERQRYVTSLFEHLAPRYDRFNRWVTFWRDERWRQKTVELLHDRVGGIVLDLAAGTGDLASWSVKKGAREVHVFDISFRMLSLARSKLVGDTENPYIRFEQGSAAHLPFRDSRFDGIVSGFAMRNVFHFLDDVLAEMHRVLKPGGRVAILELSQPENAILRWGFNLHMKSLMPLIGRIATGFNTPFEYLYETTRTFLSPHDFKERLENAGFVGVGWKTYLLGGIAIHHGSKPK